MDSSKTYDTKKIDREYKRNVNMDLVRILAVFLVISIHFFGNTGFYSIKIDSVFTYFIIIIRSFSGVCVPLFITLTGYLMANKILSKKYYWGIVKTLITYVLMAAAFYILSGIYDDNTVGFWEFIRQITSASWGGHVWYIEMYVGLFLLIPFLNLIYKGLTSKKQKIALLATLAVLTSLPSVTNDICDIIPDYWTAFYPITYYFIGSFIREFGVRLKKRYIFIIFIGCLLIFSGFDFYRSYGYKFEQGTYLKWGGFETLIDTTLVFAFISKLNLEKIPSFVKKCFEKMSGLVLGAYLSSCMFERIFYNILKRFVHDFESRMKYFFLIVLCIFICSFIFSWAINFFTEIIIDKFESIKNKRRC